MEGASGGGKGGKLLALIGDEVSVRTQMRYNFERYEVHIFRV